MIFPNSTFLQAAVTALHLVCPITTTNFDPATLQAYSIEPNTSSLTMFPATLALKTSPIPWSKTISDGTLESIQLSTAAKGNYPALVSETCPNKFLLVRVFSTNLLFHPPIFAGLS